MLVVVEVSAVMSGVVGVCVVWVIKARRLVTTLVRWNVFKVFISRLQINAVISLSKRR